MVMQQVTLARKLSGACPGGGGARGLPPHLEIEKQKKSLSDFLPPPYEFLDTPLAKLTEYGTN